MFRNYLTTALRHLRKTKVFSLVNVLGLAIGMTACLLILHYVNYEESYDQYHTNADRIYRLRYERIDDSGSAVRFASCCPPAAARIRGNYPEVEKIGRFLQYQTSISYLEKNFREERVYYAEPELLEVLKFDFVKGDPLTGIAEPNYCFISSSTASKYFGDEDPMGKTLSADKRTDYAVAGIFEDLPHNTHLKVDILLPWKNLEAAYGPDYYEAWGHTGSYTYLRLQPGTDPIEMEGKFKTLAEEQCPWLKDYNMIMQLPLQPVTDIHLTSHYQQELEANGDRDSVRFLLVIALFIMIMAWVNFINLSTAFSINRAREVGMRKVVGASRWQLIGQFFLEVVVTNLISIGLSATLVAVSLPWFSQMTGLPAGLAPWTFDWFWYAMGGIFVAGVFLSGLYPAFAMSSFKPAVVLKGKLARSVRGVSLRKALVVFQFTVGLVLVISTFTVFDQISYMRNQDLGFDMEQTLVARMPRVRPEDYPTTFNSFRETMMQRTDITKMCHVTEVPGRQIYWDAGGIIRVGDDITATHNYQIVGVDYDFVDMFDLEFAAGRNFSREFTTDEHSLVLSETAAELMGFEGAESAVGQEVNYWGEIYPVIGVLKDYHQQSLKEEYEPHIYRFTPHGRGSMGMIAMRVDIHNVSETISAVKQQYNEFFPGNPFDYFFLDDYYNQQYESDELLGRVYTLFAMLAVFIIGLGIYGLSSFSVVRLTKEIGIRKVLGASIGNIMQLLTKEFLILFIIANVVAWPIAWYAMNRWLEGYAYRTELSLVTFVLAGLATLVIAMLAVIYQVTRAANGNPMEALRCE